MSPRSAISTIMSVVVGLSLFLPAAMAARFVDLDNNWAQRYINSLSDQGVIGAEPDGKFQPDQPITRAMLCAWLVNVLGISNQPVPSQPSYGDVKPEDWFYKAVEIARQNNYISGYADGFRPQQFIQKGDVVVTLSRALGGQDPDESTIANTLKQFEDADKIPSWDRTGIAKATIDKVLINHPNPAIVDATALASRAEAAALLFQLNQYLTHQDINLAVKEAEQPKTMTSMTGSSLTDSNSQATNQNTINGSSESTPKSQPEANQAATAVSLPATSDTTDTQHQSGYAQTASGTAPVQAGASATTPAARRSKHKNSTAAQPSTAASSPTLQGGVTVLDVGTHFRTKLINTLDSTTSKVGDEFHTQVIEPVFINGTEAVPAGSTLIGLVTNVVSPRNMNFGANASIGVKFISIETPDGRKFPIDASIDKKALAKASGTDQSRTSKTLKHVGKDALIGTGVGAASGLLYSLMMGGGMSNYTLTNTAKMGVFGGVAGGGYGLASSAIRKGSEITVPAGTILPVQLDSTLTISQAVQAPITTQPSAPPEQAYPSVQTPYSYIPAQQPTTTSSSAAQSTTPPPGYPTYPAAQSPASPPGYPSYPAAQAATPPPGYPTYPAAQSPASPPGYPTYPAAQAATPPPGYPTYPAAQAATPPPGYPSYPAAQSVTPPPGYPTYPAAQAATPPPGYPSYPAAQSVTPPPGYPSYPAAQSVTPPPGYPSYPAAQSVTPPPGYPSYPAAQSATSPPGYPTYPAAQSATSPPGYPTYPAAQSATSPPGYPSYPAPSNPASPTGYSASAPTTAPAQPLYNAAH